MRKTFRLAVFLSVAAVAVAQGARAQDAEQAFRTAVLKQRLLLRSYSAEPEISAQWQDGKLLTRPPLFHTLGVFTAEKVKVSPDRVELNGTRRTLLRDGKGGMSLSVPTTKVHITVSLNGADNDTVLPALIGQLFFGSVKEALASVPVLYADALPANVPGGEPVHRESCDCAQEGAPACRGKLPNDGKKFAEIVQQPDPVFPAEALSASVRAASALSITVDLQGHPTDIWLMVPFGQGFDESALTAVAGYLFKPALCHGTAAVTAVRVVVSFEKH